MLEPASPLKTKCIPGRYGATGNAGVTLGTRAINGLWQIAGWDDFEAAAGPLLTSLHLPGLGSYRRGQTSGSVTSFRIAPDKVFLEGTGDLAGYATAELMVLDLGHARTAITLQGPSARDLLSQVIAIDTSANAFTAGDFVQTGLHHVGVLIHCSGDASFDILVPCTWAETVWEVLFENALPHGLTVKEVA